jgi:hypothetical protein
MAAQYAQTGMTPKQIAAERERIAGLVAESDAAAVARAETIAVADAAGEVDGEPKVVVEPKAKAAPAKFVLPVIPVGADLAAMGKQVADFLAGLDGKHNVRDLFRLANVTESQLYDLLAMDGEQALPGVTRIDRPGQARQHWTVTGATILNVNERARYLHLKRQVVGIAEYNELVTERVAKAARAAANKAAGIGKPKAEADPVQVKAYISQVAMASMTIDELLALVAQKQAQVQAEAIVAAALVNIKAENEAILDEAAA